MGRLIVEQIVSADGYASGPDGGIDFFSAAGDFRDCEPEQLRMLAGVRAILFGRTTYRMFADYWPQADPAQFRVAEPINTLPKFVVSNTLPSAPWGEAGKAEVLRGDGVAATRALRDRIDGDIVVWGSLTLADALLRADEVDVLRLRTVPVLIGRGRSFVPDDLPQREVRLDGTTAFPSGHIVTQYRMARTDR